jgi:hypothetical protein
MLRCCTYMAPSWHPCVTHLAPKMTPTLGKYGGGGGGGWGVGDFLGFWCFQHVPIKTHGNMESIYGTPKIEGYGTFPLV